jgi:O-methyltransferase
MSFQVSIKKKIKRNILNWLDMKGYRVLSVPKADDARLPLGLPDKELYRPFYSPWLSDDPASEFVQIYSKARPYTLVKAESCWVLYSLARQALAVEGDFCELGVFKGGSAYLLKEVLHRNASEKALHLFDTFAGMPDLHTDIDWHKGGDFRDTSLAGISTYLDSDACRYYAGVIPESFSEFKNGRIAFAHVDLDLYQSIYAAIEFILPRLVLGGVIVFDDYGFPTCSGARAAIDDYFKKTALVPLVLPTGQAIVFNTVGSFI